MATTLARGQRGIQSIEVGGRLLQALVQAGHALALKDLAALAEMPAAKAHAYLVSLVKLGLVAREATSGRYGLGPLALQLGMVGLQQLDPLALAAPVAADLAQSLGQTMALVVWGTLGPTVVHVAPAPTPVYLSLRHGTVMGLQGTASGRLLAALLPPARVLPLLRAERQRQRASAMPAAQWAALCEEVRAQGLAHVRDLLLPGVSATAVPVLDGTGQAALALTAVGPSALFDGGPGSPLACALQAAAQGISQRLRGRT